jgi:hypothetical protein
MLRMRPSLTRPQLNLGAIPQQASRMRRLFVPTAGPSDWRRLLADPQKQWRPEKSAFEAAVSWEAARQTARGLPTELAVALDTQPEFRDASLLLGLPEHQVELAGGGHASQTDFWALLAAPIGVVSTAVEAKAGEPFDKTVAEWLAGSSERSGKPARLDQLCSILSIEKAAAMDCRYQLFHRCAAAILEAKRFRVNTALLLVQAFGDNGASFRDFAKWAKLLGVTARESALHHARTCDGTDLWIGWINAPVAGPAIVRAAV